MALGLVGGFDVRHTARLVLAPLVIAGTLAACGGGPPAGTAGPIATPGQTLAVSAPAATSGSPTVPAGGTGSGYCSLFTSDEVGALLGASVGAGQPQPAKPDNCYWGTADGTTVLIQKAPEIACEGEKAGVTGLGHGVFDGDYFAGTSAAGGTIAGVPIGDSCFEVRVVPTTPKADAAAVLAFLKTFVQRVGA